MKWKIDFQIKICCNIRNRRMKHRYALIDKILRSLYFILIAVIIYDFTFAKNICSSKKEN